jgi:hypothetical protein
VISAINSPVPVVEHVLVNGKPAMHDGKCTSLYPGVVIKEFG